MNPNYAFVAERAAFVCEYCHAPEETQNAVFEVEHIIPTSQGGTNNLENLALACRACNVFKSNFLSGDNGAPLYNPRIDEWQRHFQVDLHSLEIRGLTEIGVGTINRLRLNHERQLRGRQHWRRLGLFP